MFERFTERARQVVVLAQAGARELNHDEIDSQHILLGLVREEEGVAARVLATEFNLTPERLVPEISLGKTKPKDGQIPFTVEAKTVFEKSLREALSLGHNYIGTEHLLLSLNAMNSGTAAVLLSEKFDVDPDQLRLAVMNHLYGDKQKVIPVGTNAEPDAASEGVEALGGIVQAIQGMRGAKVEIPDWVWAFLLDRRMERENAERLVRDTIRELAMTAALSVPADDLEALVQRVLDENPDVMEAGPQPEPGDG